jgi:hypothetical protein
MIEHYPSILQIITMMHLLHQVNTIDVYVPQNFEKKNVMFKQLAKKIIILYICEFV